MQQDPTAPPTLNIPPELSRNVEKRDDSFPLSKPLNTLTTIMVPTRAQSGRTWQSITVQKPTLLRYIDCNASFAETGFFPGVMPDRNPGGQLVTAGNGLVYNGMACGGPDLLLPAPGRWWISIDVAESAAAYLAEFLPIGVEDLGVLRQMIDSNSRRCTGEVDTNELATGADAVVLDMATVLRTHRMILQNTGANSIRVSLNSSPANATNGYLLTAGSVLTLEPWAMPLHQIRTFSALASTITMLRWNRNTV